MENNELLLKDQKTKIQHKKLEEHEGPLFQNLNMGDLPLEDTLVNTLKKEQGLLKQNLLTEPGRKLEMDPSLSLEKTDQKVDMTGVSLTKSLGPVHKLKTKPAPKEEAKKKEELTREEIQRSIMEDNLRAFIDFFQKEYSAISGHLGDKSYMELKNASVAAKKLCDEFTEGKKDIPLSKSIEVFSRLSQATTDYYHENRGHQFKSEGQQRKQYAKQMREKTRKLFKDLATMEIFEKVNQETGGIGAISTYSAKEKKTSEKKMKELADMKKKWSKHIARNTGAAFADDKIKDRLDIFRAYEEQIKIYKATHVWEKMDREYQLLLEEYEETLTETYVKEWAEKNDREEKKKATKNTKDMIKQHVEEEDERKGYVPLERKEVDINLTEEQEKQIAAIDQWLVQNFNNGGMLAFIPQLRNHHGDFISQILSKTKRERLHMYYLVETAERKEATALDAVISQTDYVPNLKKFKDQMIASKWKMTKYVLGGYVYMQKLSEAFRVTMAPETQNAIKDTVKLAGIHHMDKEKKEKGNPIDLAASERLYALGKFSETLAIYKKSLKDAKDAKDSEKQSKEEEAKKNAKEAQKWLRETVKYDRELGELAKKSELFDKNKEIEKTDVNLQEYSKRDEDSNLADFYIGKASLAAGKVGMAAEKAELIGISFGLDEKGFETLDLWGGSISDCLSIASSVLNMVNSIYSLMEGGEEMTLEDYAGTITDIVSSASDILGSVTSVAGNVMTMVGVAEEAVNIVSTVGTGFAGASLAMSAIQTGLKWKSVYDQSVHADNVHNYFDQKNKTKFKDKPQTEEEIKEWRKNKFEQGMVKLSDNLRSRNRNQAIYSTLNTGLSTVSLVFPGAGMVTAPVGLALTLTTTILDAIQTGGIREATFDHYFNMDKILDQVWEKSHENNEFLNETKDALKKRLRTRVAAAAGFCDLAAAQGHVAQKYADFIHDQLFGSESVKEEERKAYISLVKSLGLPYDEAKKIPSAESIKGKMAV